MKHLWSMKHLWVATLPLALAAVPASAQDEGEDYQPDSAAIPDNVQTAYVYGDDAAPPCPEDTICVVGRLPEDDRYRIPKNLRLSGDPANESWAKRAESFEITGPYGQFACTPTGSMGLAGCTAKLIEAAYEERATGSSVRFSQLIQEAREERLSTIDAETAAEQERVEALEREYLERLEREREAEASAEGAEPALPDPETEEETSDESGE